jgi:hypothetical protein
MRTFALVGLAVTALSLLAYGPSLSLPFISDDYLQIELARRYGPVSGWPDLFRDPLYRCRATSLVLTFLTEKLFGLISEAFSVSSVLLHIANCMLVFALGAWRRIGWSLSAAAACVFAVTQRHHEAVIWYAALPELLVFLFGVGAFLCWVMWIESERRRAVWYGGALALFLLALISKESAVAVTGLMLGAGLVERIPPRRLAAAILPFAALSAGYFAWGYASRGTHQHFNDGTFSLTAPVLEVIWRSGTRLVGMWGSFALAALVLWKARRRLALLWTAAAWMVIALLPYSFLTYMPRVPSRHTYLASVGLALIVAAAFVELWNRAGAHRVAATGLAALAMIGQQCGYLWTTKQHQFSQRARPTEEVIRLADQGRRAIYVKCFPYHADVATRALRILRPGVEAQTQVVVGKAAVGHPDAVDLCSSEVR